MKTIHVIACLILLSSASDKQKQTTYSQKINNSIIGIKAAKTDSVFSDQLYFALTDSVFPAWMGTKWDFNGTSNIPKHGEIACGYFVTTTLKHIGFNLNRYKLAQQASLTVVDVLCGKQKQHAYNKNGLIEKLSKLNGHHLFVVGLDYHVGYIAVEQNTVYFIHSDFFEGKVVQELASESTGFAATKAYVYGEITYNKSLFKKWRSNQKIY